MSNPTLKAEIQALIHKATEAVLKHPDKAAFILKAWMDGNVKKSTTRKRPAA